MQVAHKYVGGGGRGGQQSRGGEGQRTSDQVQIYLRGDGTQGGRGSGGDASQAILMAELMSVRHLLADASEAMGTNASAMAQLENEHDSCLEELRVARTSWQAAEMSLKVQSESVERLNAQVVQLTEELRGSRDSQNEWRTKAEELRLKLERGGGIGGQGGAELQQEVNRLEAKLSEAHRLRLLDAEKLATQQAQLERLDDLEKRLGEGEKSLRNGKREGDEWRSKAEAYAAELLAWRSKSETWEASKAQSVRGLQQERDRLQAEWQMMRQSLQSAEASLAVQTAAVQRLENQVFDLEGHVREGGRAAEGWEEREQQWKTEVLTLRTRMEADAAAKDHKILNLQDERDRGRSEVSELRMALQSAEASLAVQTAAVQRLEKQASTLMVEIRQARRSEEDWRTKGEEARSEVKALQIQLNSAVGKKEEIALEMYETRERLEGRISDLTRLHADAEARASVHMKENERIAKELELLQAELKKANEFRLRCEKLQVIFFLTNWDFSSCSSV